MMRDVLRTHCAGCSPFDTVGSKMTALPPAQRRSVLGEGSGVLAAYSSDVWVD